jgi:bacteriorhodopsin
VIDFIANVYVTFEDSWRWISFILIVLAIIWLVNLMRDPEKMMGLIPQFFATLWKVLSYLAVTLFQVTKVVALALGRVLTVTFATIRDFFISRN